MKKPYKKPLLFAESFDLLEHIASCAAADGHTVVSYRDRNSCSYQDGDVILFVDKGVNGCQNNYGPFFNDVDDYLASLKIEGGGGCYNAFSNGNVFAS